MNLFSAISPKVVKKIALAGVLEFAPVFIFLLAFEFFHVYKATIVLMITTIISTFATYKIQKRLPYVALYVALLTSIFGYITLTLHQPKFIQIRDTLYDVSCALTLVVGLVTGTQFLKVAFSPVLSMTNRAWNHFTYAWIIFFISIAVANEYVRRFMSLSAWFDFKSIIVAVTLFFGVTTLFLFYEKEK